MGLEEGGPGYWKGSKERKNNESPEADGEADRKLCTYVDDFDVRGIERGRREERIARGLGKDMCVDVRSVPKSKAVESESDTSENAIPLISLLSAASRKVHVMGRRGTGKLKRVAVSC